MRYGLTLQGPTQFSGPLPLCPFQEHWPSVPRDLNPSFPWETENSVHLRHQHFPLPSDTSGSKGLALIGNANPVPWVLHGPLSPQQVPRVLEIVSVPWESSSLSKT